MADRPDRKPDLSSLRIDRSGEPSAQGSKARIALISLAIGLAAIVGGWWFWPSSMPEVEVVTARRPTAVREASVLDASGYVTARRQATVSAKRTGKVRQVLVEEGMVVNQGDVLAYLDDSTEKAQLALAGAQLDSSRAALAETEAGLREAKLTLQRTLELSSRGLASASDLDAARAGEEALSARLEAGKEQVKVAERSVALQQQQLDETIIRAPFGGVVVAKTAQPGEMISPVSAGGGFTRTGICTIVDMDSLEIEVDVNEAYIQRVEPGQRVTAVLDAYADWRIPGEVIAIVPTADRQKATVKVRVGFLQKDGRVLPDMGVKVAFMEAGQEPVVNELPAGVLVPEAAVDRRAGGTRVWVLDGDRVSGKTVEVGGKFGESVQLIDGVAAGQRVVVSNVETLSDGLRVAVLEN